MKLRPLPGTVADYIEGSRVALRTGKRHLRCAEALAGVAEWGAAISHLVLATEEAVKADVLKDKGAKGVRSQYTDTDVQALLTYHWQRHPLALKKSAPPPWWQELVASAIMTVLVAGIEAPVETKQAAALEYAAQRRARAKAVLPVDWPAVANRFKERGMYATFINGRWESPDDWGEADYLRYLPAVRHMLGEATTRLVSLSSAF